TKEVKLPESKPLVDTAVTLSFLRKTSSFETSPELKVKYEKAKKYLTTQLGIKEKANQTVVEKVQESVTEEECEKVIKTQNNDESNKKALTWLHEQVKDEKLEKEILESCEKVVVEKVSQKKKQPSSSSWFGWVTKSAYKATEYTKESLSDAASSYLWNQADKYKEQSEKAKKYLIQELKDEKLVEELLTTSDKIIVEQSVQKEKKEAVATIKTSTTTEKANEIVSCQNDD
ncbi:hypothetical protein C1645_882503, partial [Glomus cerebriforme]